jgi:tetratricopeptide (TPR) repeat protein
VPELAAMSDGVDPYDVRSGGTKLSHPPEQERRLVFASVAQFLRAAAGESGTLLVLDDLQWAGQDAFDLLTALVLTSETPPIRLIGAYRDSETARASPLSNFMADLARASSVRVLHLDPLAAEEAEELLAALLPGDSDTRPTLPAAIVRRAGGVPFYLVSYADDLRTQSITEPDLELPWTVSQVILQRLVSLPETAQELLRVAAVVGRAVTAPLLSRVVERAEEDVIEALDVASRARLLEEDEEGKYHFTHDLIRETVEGELSSSRRRLLHRRIGEALERDPRTPVEAIAFHFDRSDDGVRASRYLERAGDDALQRFAHSAAADFYCRALDWIQRSGHPHDVADLAEKWGIALFRSGRYDEAIAALERSLDAHRSAGDAESVDRTTGMLAEAHYQRGTGHEALAQVTHLIERDHLDTDDGGSAGAPALREALVRLLYSEGSFGRLLTAGRSLRRLGRVTRNRRLQTMGTRVEGSALIFLGHLADGAAMIEGTLTEDGSLDGDQRAIEVANAPSVAYYLMGEAERCRNLSTRMLRLAESMNAAGEIGAHALLVGAALNVEGEWDRANAYLRRATEQFIMGRPTALSVRMVPILADCLIREGRWDEARRYLDATVLTARSMRAYHPERTALTLLALVDLREGRPRSTIARLEPLVTDDLGWAHAVTLLSTLAEAYLTIGDIEHAHPVAERAVTEARRMEAWMPGIDALRVLGMAETRLGNNDLADRAYQEGLQRARAIPFPYAEARILDASALLA